MHQVYVSIGSNIDRYQNTRVALDAIEREFNEIVLSKVYDCVPIGFEGDNFLNLVVSFKCEHTVAELSQVLRRIETQCGRVRTGPKFSSRTLDIDILLYDDLVGEFDGVSLPRGEITQNAFVLLPLVDIASEKVHPQHLKTYKQLWDSFDHKSQKLAVIDFQR
ncbi:2-amino-4-hydroxy-6-hydroxymethyldihydropteridine diphosphokinase [Thalassotalea sp. M1531]|uniref:2-amino-4-hydroxy-6-hydroxymethyldihydropteridine diphosphokinase n=1 Tax=Thalassotalea algicola TaxID=2716224 RepID=A0A7Y0LBZ0_9GAMM|nr:2-amino-4-hydroxy-6-hydroxymethyldihydropteridine diphosphokinase [Thalassotalea algicola]NMP31738.1 2-amino-4-hydroxy-6-hydroxymethyldihydropteridine diphosphokinase [Thalassotalea algicola]